MSEKYSLWLRDAKMYDQVNAYLCLRIGSIE